jgi:hypothetical protein
LTPKNGYGSYLGKASLQFSIARHRPQLKLRAIKQRPEGALFSRQAIYRLPMVMLTNVQS